MAGSTGGIALRLGLAAPGGVLLGIALAYGLKRIQPIFSGTLGGTLLEFVTCFGVWIVAERLGLSAVLCLVAFAMTIARSAGLTNPPRIRIHSFAVWETVVFLLNVLAFLLMGFQARSIVGRHGARSAVGGGAFCRARHPPARRRADGVGAGLQPARPPLRLAAGRAQAGESPSGRADRLVRDARAGDDGDRLRAPRQLPQRDLIVLTAFAVVLATLVVQGLTLAPLVRLMKLDGEDGLAAELDAARADLATVALATLDGKAGPAADYWRYGFGAAHTGALPGGDCAPLEAKRKLGLAAMRKQRKRLEQLRAEQKVGADAFLVLQEELDFHEVALSSEDERHIEES